MQPIPKRDDDAGEGQLRPIAVNASPAAEPIRPAAPAPAPAPTVAATATATAATAPAPVRPAPAVKAPPRISRTSLKAPSLSLKGSHRAADAATDAATRELRNAAFTDDDILRLWDKWISDHPQEVILINTMRASRPQRRDAASAVFTVTVENAAQQEKLTEFMPQLHAMLRDGVGNDSVTLDIVLNQGSSGAHTWSEREVLTHMLESTPALRGFIDTFRLNIG